MKGIRGILIFSVSALTAISMSAQKIETIDGVRIVHNEKIGRWGNNPEVKLELVRTIGGPDAQDENFAFASPYDVLLDSAGNMYLLDSGNSRIQKLDRQGKIVKTIGRRGQGPAEFQFPRSMDVDDQGFMYVLDVMMRGIQVFTSEGEVKKTVKLSRSVQNQIRVLKSGRIAIGKSMDLGTWMKTTTKLPRLVEIVDPEGKTCLEFGEPRDYKDLNVNSFANEFNLEKDGEGNFYLSFFYQNRIEKYSADGHLLWKADRALNYGTEVIDKGSIKRGERRTNIERPKMNIVSMGQSTDSRGRIWVITLNRQMSQEENPIVISGRREAAAVESKAFKMDVYKLEIYDSEGILLGAIPLNHRAHGVRIFGENLFVWERYNAAYYQYKIIENQN